MSNNHHFLHNHKRPSIEFVKTLEPHEASIVILLSPLFKLGQWFGVFPFEYDANNPQEQVYVRRCSFNYLRCLVFLGLSTCYILFHCYSLLNSVLEQRGVIDILGQSLWLQAATLSYLISIHLLRQPQALINLYTRDWRAVEQDCGRAFSSPRLRRFTRVCFFFYVALGTASMAFIAFHSVSDPDYPAYYLAILNPGVNAMNYTVLEIGAQVTVQMFFMCWKWTGMALLDLSLCIYGFTIVETMQTLMVQVNATQKEHDQIVINRKFLPALCQDRADLEPGTDMKDDDYAVSDNITSVMHITNHSNAFGTDNPKLDPNAPISTRETMAMLKLLQKFQKVSQLLNDINAALGPLLLLNYGQLIFMICALVFLPVRYYQDFNWRLTIIFGGNAFVFLGRLILLTICLGDVYPAGINLNIKVAKVMLSQRLDASLLNPILGHLSVFSANPICFNAWGFFPITRGTLLATLSVISTYIVVLLQVKG